MWLHFLRLGACASSLYAIKNKASQITLNALLKLTQIKGLA